MDPVRRRQPTEDLQATYGEDYFAGRTSGYPEIGYRQAHPDWKPWLDFIAVLKPAGTWLDVGSAFGYLAAEARRRGYRAYGVDVSRYAVRQEPEFAGFLMQAAPDLPFPRQSADIISLFDILEHLDNPRTALAEAHRVLAPEGLMVGTTPDPVFFDRDEPSHISEYPPSYWLAALESLGLATVFRFSEEAYNFQFLAAHRGSETAGKLDCFQHDHFEGSEAVLEVQEPIRAVLRAGWAPHGTGGRSPSGEAASIYLLNPAPSPQKLRIRMQIETTPGFSTLRIRLNSLLLAERFLSSEKTSCSVDCRHILLPSGGHHLFLEVAPGGPQLTFTKIKVEASQAPSRHLVETLPFDLYQRYRLAAEIAEALRPGTILDVGGHLGDQDGHLAASADFFSPDGGRTPEVWTTDLRPCDHPRHERASARALPFEDGSFDLLVSLDVLEHLPRQDRSAFLAELGRVSGRWIVLGAPFECQDVRQAERSLLPLMPDQSFLKEHKQLGLPKLDDVLDFYRQRRYETVTLPNGKLKRWVELQALTQLFFSTAPADAFCRFNRLCNRHFYPHDNAEPAYRQIVVVAKAGLSGETRRRLEALQSKPSARDVSGELFNSADFVRLVQHVLKNSQETPRALTDAQFIANERQQGLEHLLRDHEKVLKELKELNEAPIFTLIARRIRRWLK